MAGSEERESLAAEYALGTLSSAEREEVEAAMAADAELRNLINSWERRLAPLALALEPMAVPDHLRASIMEAIGSEELPAPNVVLLERRAKLWRGLAIGAWAMAAVLAGVLLFRPPPQTAGHYVAVLQSEGPGPAFVASLDLAAGTISVRPVSANTPAGKSYELWALGAGREKPQSLGVIQADFRIPTAKLGKVERAALDDTVFAVSLEPEGGSPTGQPTGPVLFTGMLVKTE